MTPKTDADHRAAWERRALRAEAALTRIHELAAVLDRGIIDADGRQVGLAGPNTAALIRAAAAGQVVA